MSKLEDQQLVRACLKGDNQAFEWLIERYQKPLFNVALRMVRDFDDAQDVTQTVFVKAYEKLDSFNPKYKFFSWIYRMAINESINFLNQRKIHDELDSKIISKDKSPEQQLQQSELEEQVGSALMRLPVNYRAVIVLKHLEELSYKEISYILDTPEKTVKSRLFTARQQLKDVLLKQGMKA